MYIKTLAEEAKIVEALAPATDAAGRNGDCISLKDAVSTVIALVQITQGNAATVQVSVEQATAVDGSGAKAGPACRIWANLDTAASDALVRKTDGASFTTDAGLKNKLIVIEIDPTALDAGFDCVRIKTGASNVANITSGFYLVPMRHGGLGSPSVIVD